MAAAIIKRLENRRAALEYLLTTMETTLQTASAENAAFVFTLKQNMESLVGGAKAMAEICGDLELHGVDHHADALQFCAKLVRAAGKAEAIIDTRGSQSLQPREAVELRKLCPLPQLALSRFSGKIEGLPAFRNLFHRIVGENSGILGIEMLMHLRTCLAGQPLNMVEVVAISDKGFVVAWQLLSQYYKHKNRLIRAHLDANIDLPETKRVGVESLPPNPIFLNLP